MRRLDTSLSDDIATHFGPYELVRRLGVGGTAETFEAIRRREGGFSQRVCLKVVLPFYANNETFTKLFQREAMLAAKLRHRNIVGVIDFGEVDGRSYLALELVDGIDLRTLLDTSDRHRLDPDLVVLFGLELAAALVHAHNPPSGSGFDGLVHRDISPSNVLISRQGEIMLTDFGVAKPMADLRRKSSEAKGKFPYMSPEQLRAESADARSDLFAVGVVLFEALAGVRPYEGANDPATIMQILNGDHAELVDWVPDAPPKLCAVIERLIHPDPDQRIQTAAALIEELAEMAPSPRVHKRLGSLVEARMDAERTSAREVSSTVGKTPTAGAAQALKDAGATEPAKPPAPAGTSRRKAWLATLAAMILVGAAAFALRPGQPETIGHAATDTGADAVTGTGTETVADTAVDTRADTETVADTAADTGAVADTGALPVAAPAPPPKPAHLDVIVIPWGEIWINGKRQGAAPIMDKTLKPGRYRISAGQEGPSQSKTVRLRPGERKTVNFDLTE